MKCQLSKCKASCCYNLSFNQNELERFSNKIVNPVLEIVTMFGVNVVFTAQKMKDNKCPFLRHDFKCNIYENRPEVCRKMGEIDQMPCVFIRNKK